ncbi:hypothetical protein FJU30_16975 [Affinibrenneria salicis]|uniref:Uncharacterized protein n=1 Tax=Affinibrenneria salicis TaxID=2590031 RepID=A0A5J5FX22_9GAMM|nr:hypothetical protein [Affinibrenneria salicis]KAA8998111.1 hypothetical protein FJU30_16975 [Affinibrenneria salicis]
MKISAQSENSLSTLRREGKLIEREIRSRDPNLAARVEDVARLVNPAQSPAIPRPAGLPVVLTVFFLLIVSALSVIILNDNFFLAQFYIQSAIVYFILMIFFVIFPAFAGMYLISRGYSLGLEIHYWLSLAALILSLAACAVLAGKFLRGDVSLFALITQVLVVSLAFFVRRLMRSASFATTVRRCRTLRIVATLREWRQDGKEKF